MRLGIREIIFLLVLLAMPISSYWFVFKPQNAEIKEAKQEIEHKERLLQKLDAATAQAADLERANSEIAEAIRLIEERLPNDKEVDVILKQIAEHARAQSLVITKVKAKPALKSSRFMEKPLEMTIEGNFDNFYTFLLELEKLDRITRVPTLVLERSNENDGSMGAKFTLSIYFEPTQAVAEVRP
jgi:type IV pilus assembly protein PilO